MAQQENQKNRSIPVGTLYVSTQYLKYNNNDINNTLRHAWKNGVLVNEKLNPQSDFTQLVLDAMFPVFDSATNPRRYYVSFNSMNPNSKDGTSLKIVIRPEIGPRLAALFPKQQMPVALGTITDITAQQGGVLYIDRIQLINKCDNRNFENPIDVHVKREVTENLTDNVLTTEHFSQFTPISQTAENEFQEWFDYLKWRFELVIKNIKGIRYENLSFDQAAKQGSMTILVKDQRSLRRIINTKEPLTICSIENSEDVNNWKPKESIISQPNTFHCVTIDKFNSFSEIKEGAIIEAGYYPCQCTFEISNANQGKTLGREDYINGFIFESIVGDCTLYKRMNLILSNIQDGSLNYCPFLTSYLFDSKQAQLPQKLEELEFINTSLNDAQKEAVQKMVSAPEIAFIQGPPGTGKTTVIAEAVHQFVKRKQKVLISSQSIAAVDNALERLNTSACIAQPIRLKRFSDSEQNCKYDEQNAIPTWYQSLATPIAKRLESWANQQERINKLKEISNSLTAINNQISSTTVNIEQEDALLKQNDEKLQELKIEVDAINSRDSSVHNTLLFLDYIRQGNSMRTAFSESLISENALHTIEDCILPVFNTLKDQGCYPFFDYSRSAESKTAIATFRRCLQKWQEILRLETQLSEVIERLSLQKGEGILDLSAAAELHKIEQDITEIDEQFDLVDDTTYATLRQKRKELVAAKKAIESQGRLPVGLVQSIFNVRNADKTDVAEYLLQTERTRSEVLPILTMVLEEIRRVNSEISTAVETCKEQIVQLYGKTEQDDQTLSRYNQLQHSQNMSMDRRSRYREKISVLNQQIDNLRRDYSQTFQCNLNTIPQLPTQFAQQVNNMLTSLSEKWENFMELSKTFTPIYQTWITLLKNCSNEESSQLLSDYKQNCNVVGITCTENFRTLKDNNFNSFDVVIIDEVSKATPPELLIPMAYGKKVILIGDHRQLPPNFDQKNPSDRIEQEQSISEENVLHRNREYSSEKQIMEHNMIKYRELVENSLFKRGFENADNSIKSSLWVQYRMHPQIMTIINQFYDGKLMCGIDNPTQSREHGLNLPYIPSRNHVVWIDSSKDLFDKYVNESTSGYSFDNPLESDLIIKALSDIDNELAQSASKGSPIPIKTVGIITFYMGQCRLLRNSLKELQEKSKLKYLKVKISTVDRFQGQECDYIFVSMVRNTKHVPKSKNAFIKRFERVNVAFSRAKELLVIVGASSFFKRINVCMSSLNGEPIFNNKVYNEIYTFLNSNKAVVTTKDVLKHVDLNEYDNPLQKAIK